MIPTETYLLIKFSCNYADEFDVEGFTVWKQSEWTEHFNHLKNNPQDFPVEYPFGSNEEITFQSAQDLLSCCKITEISETEYNTFKKLFHNGSYGSLPTIFVDNLDWSL